MVLNEKEAALLADIEATVGQTTKRDYDAIQAEYQVLEDNALEALADLVKHPFTDNKKVGPVQGALAELAYLRVMRPGFFEVTR